MPGLTDLPSTDPTSLDSTRTDRFPYRGEKWRVSARIINRLRTYAMQMGEQLGLGDGTTVGSIQYHVNRFLEGGTAPVEIVAPSVAGEWDAPQYLGLLQPTRYASPEIRLRAVLSYIGGSPDTQVRVRLYDASGGVPVIRATRYLPPGSEIALHALDVPLTVNAAAPEDASQILPSERSYFVVADLVAGDAPSALLYSKVWFDVKGSLIAAGAPAPDPDPNRARVFLVDTLGDPDGLPQVDRMAPDAVGVTLLSIGMYNTAAGYRDGDTIVLRGESALYGVRSWLCLDSSAAVWRPLARNGLSAFEDSEGVNVVPDDNVTLIYSHTVYLERHQGTATWRITGRAQILPTAAGPGSVLINLTDIAPSRVDDGFNSEQAFGHAAWRDNATGVCGAGVVDVQTGSTYLRIRCDFADNTPADLTFDILFDASVPDPS